MDRLRAFIGGKISSGNNEPPGYRNEWAPVALSRDLHSFDIDSRHCQYAWRIPQVTRYIRIKPSVSLVSQRMGTARLAQKPGSHQILQNTVSSIPEVGLSHQLRLRLPASIERQTDHGQAVLGGEGSRRFRLLLDPGNGMMNCRGQADQVVLPHIIDRSVLERFLATLLAQGPGNKDKRHRRRLVSHNFQGGQPIKRGRREIRKDQVNAAAIQRRHKIILRVNAMGLAGNACGFQGSTG